MLVDVITIPVPTVDCANVPNCTKFTTSGLITPTKVPPVTLAVFVRSYCLFDVVAPVIVIDLTVIEKFIKAVPVQLLVGLKLKFNIYVPTLVGAIGLLA